MDNLVDDIGEKFPLAFDSMSCTRITESFLMKDAKQSLLIIRDGGVADFNYHAYMHSKVWENRRERYYLDHPRRCRACLTEENIHLHHLSYDRVGDEPDTHLMALCQRCHSIVHDTHRIVGGSLYKATRDTVRMLKAPTRRARRRKPAPVGRNEPNARLFEEIYERQRVEVNAARRKNADPSEHLRAVARWKRANGIPI